MRAAVEERTDPALDVAQHDDRAQTETRGDEVVVSRDLALMRAIDPVSAEMLVISALKIAGSV